MLDLQRPHRVRRRQVGQQLHRTVHPQRVLVGESTAAGHQSVEYYASRPTPPRKPRNRPLELEVCDCVGAVISPCLANICLHRLDRQWQTRGHGVLVRYADDLLAICTTKQEAEGALEALTAILAELGLELKTDKTRIVHLREGGEGVDFLGFHHRYVRGNTPRSRHFAFLVRWPSRQAMGRARQRIREITDRSRLKVPIEAIVHDLNQFMRGWAGYFRYGNSARQFTKIMLHAYRHLARFIAKHHKQRKRYGFWVLRPDTGSLRADHPQRNHRRAAAEPAVASRELNADGEERR